MEERGSALICYIVDASVIGPLIFEDEAGNIMAGLEACLAQGTRAAPAHWRLEIANQLIIGVRRDRVERARIEELLAEVLALPVAIEDVRLDEALTIAADRGLTIYDAAYLQLAKARALPLLTFDRRLAAAANYLDVPTPGAAVPT